MARKYERHYRQQSDNILDCAETLILQHGIDEVSISDIAKAAEVTRATVYKYFTDKQDILWAVFFHNQSVIMDSLITKFDDLTTTYQRFEALTRWPADDEDEYDQFLLYTELFFSIYLKADVTDDSIWNNPYNRHHIKPGETAMLLIQDFHDGSVRDDLDPKQTSVAFLYAVYACASFMLRNRTAIPKKYGLDIQQVYETQIHWILQSIKA